MRAGMCNDNDQPLVLQDPGNLADILREEIKGITAYDQVEGTFIEVVDDGNSCRNEITFNPCFFS